MGDEDEFLRYKGSSSTIYYEYYNNMHFSVGLVILFHPRFTIAVLGMGLLGICTFYMSGLYKRYLILITSVLWGIPTLTLDIISISLRYGKMVHPLTKSASPEFVMYRE